MVSRAYTVEVRKFDYGSPPIPKPKKEGTPARSVPGPYSNFPEPSARVPVKAVSRGYSIA